jgi:hypothetical protein
MTDSAVGTALTAAEAWLFRQDSPEAVIGRAEAGRTGDVAEDAARWIQRILDLRSADGSWSGEVLTTAKSLLTIRELLDAGRLQEQDPGIGQGVEWLKGRRGLSGAWSDGCSSDRHRLGLCHHFLGGFFSPSPPEVPPSDTALRCGVVAADSGEARFLASAVALRSVLVCGGAPSTDSRLHLEGIRRTVRQWTREPVPGLSPVSLLTAIRTLISAPAPENHDVARDGLHSVAGRQRGDGSWVAIDPFQALGLFLAARDVDVCSQLCHRALWHGARLLVSAQNRDGTWGPEAVGRRVLIGCRALRSVERGG